jgi:hypothetical protein
LRGLECLRAWCVFVCPVVLAPSEGFVFALFCTTLCGQEPECVRWYRRCHVIHAVHMYSSNSVPTADGAERESVVAAKRTHLGTDDDSVAKLLLDPRLTSCHGSLVSSHIMGQVVTMLSGCCEQKYCPFGKQFSSEIFNVVAPVLPGYAKAPQQTASITTFFHSMDTQAAGSSPAGPDEPPGECGDESDGVDGVLGLKE